MSILNLRDERPPDAPDPTEDLVLPEEPPGLAAIRNWIQKPRPRLNRVRWGVRLWAGWIRDHLRNATKWISEHGRPALRRASKVISWAGRVAAKAAPLLQVLGQTTRQISGILREWTAPGSALAKAFPRLAATARRLGDYGVRLVRTATRMAGIGQHLRRGGRLLDEGEGNDPPPEDNDDDHDDLPDDLPGARRVLPVRPDSSGDVKTKSDAPSKNGGERQRLAGRSQKVATAPEPSPPKRRLITTPDGTAVAPSGPDRRARIRQEKFPLDLYGRIVALGPRPRTHVLRPVIVAILRHRGSTTPAELGELLQMDPANLTKRHLSPMVGEGVLKRLHPEVVNHPAQAYRPRTVRSGNSDRA